MIKLLTCYNTKISNVYVTNIDHKDAPDYSDAYIESGWYDGIEMTDSQLEILNSDSDFVHEVLMLQLY